MVCDFYFNHYRGTAFCLLGTILSGFIEVYVTPDLVQRFLPRNRFLRILFGTFIGFVFPSCECGIVPIITRFLEKKSS